MTPTTEQRENRVLASELKFLVPLQAAHQIRAWAAARMAPDSHASDESGDGYHITSIYFDSEDFDVFHRNGSFGRAKFRVRRYGASNQVFLERKLRTSRMLTKRRTLLNIDRLAGCVYGTTPSDADAWFPKRLQLRRLNPVCQVGYDRTARVLSSTRGLCRLTIDQGLRACPVTTLQFRDPSALITLLEESAIVEMKFQLEMPLLFKNLAAEFALNPLRISKYRLAVHRLQLARDATLPKEDLDSLSSASSEPIVAYA